MRYRAVGSASTKGRGAETAVQGGALNAPSRRRTQAPPAALVLPVSIQRHRGREVFAEQSLLSFLVLLNS